MIYFRHCKIVVGKNGKPVNESNMIWIQASDPFVGDDEKKESIFSYVTLAKDDGVWDHPKKIRTSITEFFTERKMLDGISADKGWAVISVSKNPKLIGGNLIWAVTFGQLKDSHSG